MGLYAQARTTSFALCGTVLVLAAALCAQTSTTVRHHQVPVTDTSQPPELTQAEAAIEKRDYPAAAPLLQKVVQADPANYQAWFYLGFTYNALGQIDNSIDAYRQSVKAKPDVFESNLNLGLMLAKYRKPGAEDALRAATKLKPTDRVAEGQARAWFSLGEVLASSNPTEALAAYQQAATLQPKDPAPHLAAGAIFEQLDKFAEAEQEYKQALALDPTSSDAIVGLANVYMRGRRFPEAEEFLRKVVAQRTNDPAPHVQLARVLAADQKTDDAIKEFQEALKLAPGDHAVQRDLADTYYAAERYSDAENIYRSLLQLEPKNADLHHSLGQALMKQKKFSEAEAEFINTVQLKPDWGEAYGELAIVANENQHYPLTIKALDYRAKFLPELPVTYFLRATAYDHLKNMQQAAANYHLFLQSAQGKYPDQEWQARHRLIAIEPNKK